MDIELLERTIRSNLVSYGLLVYQIEEITKNITNDVVKLMVEDEDDGN